MIFSISFSQKQFFRKTFVAHKLSRQGASAIVLNVTQLSRRPVKQMNPLNRSAVGTKDAIGRLLGLRFGRVPDTIGLIAPEIVFSQFEFIFLRSNSERFHSFAQSADIWQRGFVRPSFRWFSATGKFLDINRSRFSIQRICSLVQR